MIKGTELKQLFQNQLNEIHFYKLFKKRKLRERIERVRSYEYYNENSDGTYRVVEFYEPDLDVRNKKRRRKIMDGNDSVGRCLNCKLGAIFNIDPIERIGQCNSCFTEFKLEG